MNPNPDIRRLRKQTRGYFRPLTSLQAKVRIENPGSTHDTARCWCAACKALRAFAAGIVR